MTTVEYQITMLAGLDSRYVIKFQILKKETAKACYQVWFYTINLAYHCRSFQRLDAAYVYVNSVMKLAMKNEFLYRICVSCLEPIFYPQTICGDCGMLNHTSDYLYKNEKIQEHYIKLYIQWIVVK